MLSGVWRERKRERAGLPRAFCISMITFLLGYPARVSEEETGPGFNLSHLRSVI